VGIGKSSPNFSRASSRDPKCNSRCSIKTIQRQSGVVPQALSVSSADKEIKLLSRGGFIRNSHKLSASKVCGVEAGSSSLEDRRLCYSMERSESICVSPILSPKQRSGKDRSRSGADNAVDRTSMADATMVSATVKNVSTQTSFAAKRSRSSASSTLERGTSSAQVNVVSRMACVSQHLTQEGISGDASELMLASWRGGTQRQYSGAWKVWVRWCRGKKIDPLHTSIGNISQFLASLYKRGFSYSTVNTYRSAISMTHLPIEGVAVGNHYWIKRLMKGIFNKRPPMPRYVSTWPVSRMLLYLKSLPPNDKLSRKLLTWKTAVLVALVSADRGDAITALNIDFMSKDSKGYHFLISKPTKTTRPGHGIKQIDLPKYLKDRRICVSYCLDSYLKVTKATRTDKQLFLSYVKPYKAVTRASIARWIKMIMKKAGIDISIFRPHSTRSAATSAAYQQGVSVPEILKHADWGNASVFHKYYNRPRVHQDFAQAILSIN